MSYSRRQLEALGEPLGESVTQRKLGGGYVAGGGGSSAPAPQPTTMTTTTSNIPDWAIPYATRNLGQAEALTSLQQNPYQTYQGQRTAGFSPLQTQAFGNIQGQTLTPQTAQATGMAGLAGLGGLNAATQYAAQATSPTATASYMSPYMQNVVDFQKAEAVRDYARQLPTLGAQAAQMNALGGNRRDLIQSEAQRNLQNQLAGITATGSQQAFDAARQAQQYAAGLGLQGLQVTGQQASTLGQLGQAQYAQQQGINQALMQAGAQQQALAQQDLGQKYQEFLNQQNYPYKQLGFMSDIIRGTPTSGGAASIYQTPPSSFSQTAGLLGGLGSLYGAYNRAPNFP